MKQPAQIEQLRIEFRQLQICGATNKIVRERYGRSHSWLAYWRNKFGLPPFETEPWTETRKPRAGDWTPEEDRALAEAIADGLTLGECAERVGRTYSAVSQRRSRLGLPKIKHRPRGGGVRDTWTPAKLSALQRLRAQRLSIRRCAAHLKMTPGAVAGAIFRNRPFLECRS